MYLITQYLDKLHWTLSHGFLGVYTLNHSYWNGKMSWIFVVLKHLQWNEIPIFFLWVEWFGFIFSIRDEINVAKEKVRMRILKNIYSAVNSIYIFVQQQTLPFTITSAIMAWMLINGCASNDCIRYNLALYGVWYTWIYFYEWRFFVLS